MIRGPHQCKGKQCVMNFCPSTSISGKHHPRTMGEGAHRVRVAHISRRSAPLSPVILGVPHHRCHSGARAQRGSPESITTIWEYGFRARRFAAPRNDSGECREAPPSPTVSNQRNATLFEGDQIGAAKG